MTTSLTKGATVLVLPDDLLWPDELTWTPVVQKTGRSIEGALIVDAALKVGGRPITLSGAVDSAWTLRSDMLTLQAWAAIPLQLFTLTYLGTSRTVLFDQENGALTSTPVVDYSDPLNTDPHCSVTLRFLET